MGVRVEIGANVGLEVIEVSDKGRVVATPCGGRPCAESRCRRSR